MNEKEKLQVLFICRHNSCRSQMAEGLLRHRFGDQFEVYSAGLEAKGMNPRVPDILGEIGIDVSDQKSEAISHYQGYLSPHYSIIVCDVDEDECPSISPFTRIDVLHWPFEDPSEFKGNEEDTFAKFREVRDQIDQRLQEWVASLPESAAKSA